MYTGQLWHVSLVLSGLTTWIMAFAARQIQTREQRASTRPAEKCKDGGGFFCFLSVCKGLQSSWRTSQSTINVKHRNDCRSGTYRRVKGPGSLLLVESLKVYPRIFLSFLFETLKPSLVFGIHQDHFFYLCFVSVLKVMAFAVITLERNEKV